MPLLFKFYPDNLTSHNGNLGVDVINFLESNDTNFVEAAKAGTFKGAVKNLNNNDYHSLKNYWSSSDLKYMYSKSPAHFKDKYFGANKDPKKLTDDMILGSLVHCMLLEPQDFQKNFFLMPDLNFRTNEGKAHREAILAANPYKTMITDEILAKAQCMIGRATANPLIRNLLGKGHKEVSFFWKCPYSDLNFKAKLDQFSDEYWCEVKTTKDASPENFARHLFNMNYDLSLVHYREAVLKATDKDIPIYFIVIESEPPFVTQVYKVGYGCLATGHDKWLTSINNLANGIHKNEWPGYFPQSDTDIPEINSPSWAVNKLMPKEENGI